MLKASVGVSVGALAITSLMRLRSKPTVDTPSATCGESGGLFSRISPFASALSVVTNDAAQAIADFIQQQANWMGPWRKYVEAKSQSCVVLVRRTMSSASALAAPPSACSRSEEARKPFRAKVMRVLALLRWTTFNKNKAATVAAGDDVDGEDLVSFENAEEVLKFARRGGLHIQTQKN